MYSNQNITHTKHEKTYQKVEATIYIGMKKQKNVKKIFAKSFFICVHIMN